MGANLARNIERNGYICAVYNRTAEVTRRFSEEYNGNFLPSYSLEDFVSSLVRPRKILLMVKAGVAVDAVIDALLPYLEEGDLIADLGNSHFKDTKRRGEYLSGKGIRFLGVGISGGEEGALWGPSIMAGGDRSGWEEVRDIFDKISAKAPDPCHAYIGPEGSGHFVKMVHNGIEYGDMQLIAESYHLLKEGFDFSNELLGNTFAKWNEGVLSSYLIEITSRIFKVKDREGDGYLLDKILDKAHQKGTGKWTVETALELGVAVPVIASAVTARGLSMIKDERVKAAQKLKESGSVEYGGLDRDSAGDCVESALYCSKIMSYAQGLSLIKKASDKWKWGVDIGEVASIWRGGCIIRASFLDDITLAYKEDSSLDNLVLAPFVKEALLSRLNEWRKAIAFGVSCGIPLLGMSSALAYYDSYRRANLPQNLTQAQRDFFGAHTYERVDKEGVFHTEWEEENQS
ncbi:MAG: NADP-dependent phosphogluconate dehydrogenase [Candidatus Dadabacteria bacterium]|nr:MAG: NADP-dependent phosphogluconate dehydrogenase [Candidatus Dadabacteria bacterium]